MDMECECDCNWDPGEEAGHRMGCATYKLNEERSFVKPLQTRKDYPVKEMRLCEQDHVVLRPDQLYLFTVDEECKRCKEIAALYEGA